MQFKNLEILYFLALLIIPILVHLFQLQKFVKIPFTNVAFLQQLQQNTRKSSQLKKWLLLATRMLLFTAIIFAFAQPYFSNSNIDKKKQIFIYLDNSFSMNSKGEKGNLLHVSVQEIIENTQNENRFSLMTNDLFLEDISKQTLKNALLKIKPTHQKKALKEVLLNIEILKKTNSNTIFKNILVSDFQQSKLTEDLKIKDDISLVQVKSVFKNNVSIEGVFVESKNAETVLINTIIKNQGIAKSDIPIALYDAEKLVSKKTFSIAKNEQKNVQFSIQQTNTFLGEIILKNGDAFAFDNQYYFALNSPKKMAVLSIGNSTQFLKKIFTDDEFNFTQNNLKNLHYNRIENQQLIILNEQKKITKSLSTSLIEFSKKGGNLVIIPHENLNIQSYNSFLSKLTAGNIQKKVKKRLKITEINYDHPLFANAFTKKVTNFQYPSVNGYFPSKFKNESTLVSFENNASFAKQINLKTLKIYWVSSSLHKKNSNFTNSPLIVPLFYNFAKNSFNTDDLQYHLGENNTINVMIQLKKDAIITLKNNENSFIPLQQTYQNKAQLFLNKQPKKIGFYEVSSDEKIIKKLAFNVSNEESLLRFLNLKKFENNEKNIYISNSVSEVFNEIHKKNEVQWIWKWFLAIAIVSLLLEIFILKFFKV